MAHPNERVLESYDQDPETGKWVAKYDDPLAGYFVDTPRGTPVLTSAIGDHLEPLPEPHPDNDPRETRWVYKRVVFWGHLLRKESNAEFADGFPIYRRAIVLRKDLTSKRDLYPLVAVREDDAEGVRELFRAQREKLDQAQAEATQREATWQARQAEKLRADKLKAERLGLSLEEYLVGLATLRQMRHVTKPGCCLICKRPLSLSTSVKRGVGPECYSRLTVAERISAAAETVARVVGGAVA
jgi:hypothetical protein